MVFANWIIPLFIGIIAVVLLMMILYNNPKVKQAFSDLGALIQLETSRPVYYGIGWIPNNIDKQLSPNITQGAISSSIIPFPQANYYPKIQLNNNKNTFTKNNDNKDNNDNNYNKNNKNMNNNLAFMNPNTAYDSHKAYYWALSGGYPYPYPIIYGSAVNMDKVKGIQE